MRAFKTSVFLIGAFVAGPVGWAAEVSGPEGAVATHSTDVDVTIEGPRIVLRGHLPSVALKRELVPAIRLAGVLDQICNCVEVN